MLMRSGCHFIMSEYLLLIMSEYMLLIDMVDAVCFTGSVSSAGVVDDSVAFATVSWSPYISRAGTLYAVCIKDEGHSSNLT